MGQAAVLALRIVLVVSFLGTLFVQAVMIPLIWKDIDDADVPGREVMLVLMVLGIVTVQVCAFCVWKLLTMMKRGTVFSPAAFRWVDIIIGAIAVASLLAFGFGAAMAPSHDIAPGLVLLVGGAGIIIAGVALIVFVLRMLLAQAVDRDAQARALQAELDEVI